MFIQFSKINRRKRNEATKYKDNKEFISLVPKGIVNTDKNEQHSKCNFLFLLVTYMFIIISFSLKQPPIHHSKSFSAEGAVSDNLSGSQIIPRIRTVQSASTLADEQKKHKKRRRRRAVDETSGYSTTSLSELSEFESPRRKAGSNSRLDVIQHRRQESTEDDRSERSRVSRTSQATSRVGSEVSKTTANSRRFSEVSKLPPDRGRRESPYQRREQYKNNGISSTPQRPPSRARSTTSLHSEISVRSNQSGQSRGSRTSEMRKNSRVLEEGFDPFAFIQPVPEPFSKKVKKTLGPIFGILLLLILAASLGAAIYFAVELKSKF